jgi:hypothetical protein
LRHIKSKDDLQSHAKLHFSLGEKALALIKSSIFPGFLELVTKALTRFSKVNILGPRIIDYILEPRHFDPKVLKAEGFWFLRATLSLARRSGQWQDPLKLTFTEEYGTL